MSDDGPGIPDEDAERVFDRFTRLDDGRSCSPAEDGGSRLGLAIVRATGAAHAARPGWRTLDPACGP